VATITIADGAAQVWLTYAMLPVGAYFFVLGVIDLRDHRRREDENRIAIENQGHWALGGKTSTATWEDAHSEVAENGSG
jgi:hypothetical protein